MLCSKCSASFSVKFCPLRVHIAVSFKYKVLSRISNVNSMKYILTEPYYEYAIMNSPIIFALSETIVLKDLCVLDITFQLHNSLWADTRFLSGILRYIFLNSILKYSLICSLNTNRSNICLECMNGNIFRKQITPVQQNIGSHQHSCR